MPLVNRCGGGGAKINGIVESYLVAAGETISAGDFVSFINEDADEIVKNKVQRPSAGSAVVFESGSTSYISATVLSATSVLVAYRDNSNSGYGTAVVLTISGATITSGTPVVFESAAIVYCSAVALSSTSVLVSYQDGGNSGYGTAVVLTISGTTITVGTPVVFESASTTYISAVLLSATSVLVAYRDNGNSNYGTAIILTISGTTITAGTPVVFESASTQYISATVLSATSVLIAYSDNGNSYYDTAVVLTISGTTITAGTPVVFESAISYNISATKLSSTSVLIAYRDVNNSYYGTAIILTISGTTITVGTPVVFESASTLNISAVLLSAISVLVAYSDVGNSSYGTAIILTISGTTITVGTPVVFESAGTSDISAAVLSSTSVLVAYQDVGSSSQGTSVILTISQMLSIVGVAKEAGTGGDTIDVYTPAVPVLPVVEEEFDLSPYILDLLGTLSFSGTYATSTYFTQADCTWACNSNGEIILIIRGGTSTAYENIIFTLVSAPTGVAIKTGSSSWDTSNPTQQYYGCVLTGVTQKVNIAVNLSAVNSTYDYVQCALTVTAA